MTGPSSQPTEAASASAAASATAGPATKTSSRASKRSLAALDPGVGYPHGHLGHLTAAEEAALLQFKTHLASSGLYAPGPPPSHEDAALLRFLRARRWVVADAAAQFRDTEAWRAAISIDVLYDTIDVGAYEQSRRLYPQWTGRRDRRGIPVYLFEIRHLDSKTIAGYEKSTAYSRAPPPSGVAKTTPQKLVRLFALYENLTRFAQPLCSQLTDREFPETPITLSTNIVDVSGVSLKMFWNLKGHMQVASQLATAHYPETLDRIFVSFPRPSLMLPYSYSTWETGKTGNPRKIEADSPRNQIVGAPNYFSTVWGWVKRWFDPVTVSKIFILSQSEVLPTLSRFIDPENIPKHYGGKLEFNWCEMPNLDPKIKDLATWENGHTAFPTGPMYWVPAEGGRRLDCLARGTVDKVERNEKVCSIPVAFPPGEGEEPVANGNGVEPAAAAAAGGEKLEEVPADVPASTESAEETGRADAPVATDGVKTVGVPAVTSPAGDKSVDAPEAPLASPAPETVPAPVVDVQGVQNLSLQEANEKVGDTEAVPNGKPFVS